MNDNEATMLACMLMDPTIIFNTVLTERHYEEPEHRRILKALSLCVDRRMSVDYISIGDIAPDVDRRYLATISDKVPSAANWKYYEKKVLDGYQRRRLMQIGAELREVGLTDDPIKAIERAEVELLELGTNSQSRKVTRIGEAMPEAIQAAEERFNLKGHIPGIGSGLPMLDGMTGGFQADRYVIIGARPSDGKSALALNMACDIAIRQNTPVGFISAESSNSEIVTRALCSEGRIPGGRLMTGLLSGADFTNLMDTGERMRECPLYLYDAPNLRFSELKSVARQMVSVQKIKALFVDYIQIVQWEDSRLAIHEQVAAISRGLKQLARELKIPIIGLSQLKRDSEGREPEMADLDYSKQLEQDADALILIYHPRVKEGEAERSSMLLVKKNRDGAKGAVFVRFAREYVKFFEVQYK